MLDYRCKVPDLSGTTKFNLRQVQRFVRNHNKRPADAIFMYVHVQSGIRLLRNNSSIPTRDDIKPLSINWYKHVRVTENDSQPFLPIYVRRNIKQKPRVGLHAAF